MLSRSVAILVSLAALLAVFADIAGDPGLVLDLRAASFVLGGPLLVAVAMRSPGAVLAAFADVLSAAPEDLPPERRERSADIVAALGGQALAIGVLVVFVGARAQLSVVAREGGSVTPSAIVADFGGLLLAPVYGLALWALVCTPLAARLR